MNKSVIIMGGGVAGMSAAHELAERGFHVTVFEKQKNLPGGKARSVPVPGSATGDRLPLPGEHGFRFFPGFYKHVTDTMKRIPYKDPETGRYNTRGVFDNLVECPKMMLAGKGKTPLVMYDHFPRSLKDLFRMVSMHYTNTDLTDTEKNLIAGKLWQLMTSCPERRLNEYEHVGWWEYTDAENQSDTYRTFFVNGTRTLVAARARDVSTKTAGDIFLQLLFGMVNPLERTDRVLCGPTNEKWLIPWLLYLREKGVDFQFDSVVSEVECKDGKVSGVWVSKNQGPKLKYSADYYLCAMPVERTAKILSEEILNYDPCLSGIKQLSPSVAWMNGIQFYLTKKLDIVQGHIVLTDSPWSLTAISQLQFWKDFNATKYGNGEVQAIISVDISEWEKPGVIPYKDGNGNTVYKPAKDCNREEVFADVWEQMKMSFNVDGNQMLEDKDVYMIHLDGDIKFGSNDVSGNEEPLLVNKVHTWELRPEPYTDIPNLFLSGDYVQTYTDLATMEGANESARRAVNCIIDASDTNVPKCKLWELREPDILLYYKFRDKKRYKEGLPWKLEKPDIAATMNRLFQFIQKFQKQ